MPRGDENTIRSVLDHDVWAVVGLTTHEWRAAFGVARFLAERGKTIVPINLKGEAVHGFTGYRTLADVPHPVDVVDIFRRSQAAGAHVDEAIAVGAHAVWLQLGVIDEAAADRAAEAGLAVVMDHCPAIEWPRLGLDSNSLSSVRWPCGAPPSWVWRAAVSWPAPGPARRTAERRQGEDGRLVEPCHGTSSVGHRRVARCRCRPTGRRRCSTARPSARPGQPDPVAVARHGREVGDARPRAAPPPALARRNE